jgi:hypothetical protein
MRSHPLPGPLADLLASKESERWSGTVTLNMKEGAVIAYEVTEKVRISQRE